MIYFIISIVLFFVQLAALITVIRLNKKINSKYKDTGAYPSMEYILGEYYGYDSKEYKDYVSKNRR